MPSLKTQAILWPCLILALLIPYLTIIPDYFPYSGLSLSLISVTLFVFTFKKKSRENWPIYFWLTMTLLFSFLLLIRSNPLLTTFNLFAVGWPLSFLIYTRSNSANFRNLSFWKLLVLPFYCVADVLETKNKYPFSLAVNMLKLKKNGKDSEEKSLSQIEENGESLSQNINTDQENKQKKVKKIETSNQIVLGVLLTFGLLLVILPLLSSSNPIFARYISQIFQSLFDFLREILEVWTLFRLLAAVVLFLFLSRLASFLEVEEVVLDKQAEAKEADEKAWLYLIPKAVLFLVMLIFFAAQLQLYFASSSQLQELGYSYSSLNNEVFGQLSLVCLIIFLLIYFDRHRQKFNYLLSWFLGLQSLFLLSVSGKSVYDYIANWGLTFKRLYGVAVVLLILGIFVLLGFYLAQKLQLKKFLASLVALTCLVLLGVNVANFDYLIYANNGPRESTGTDYTYYSQLSSDAGNLDKILEKMRDLRKSGVKPTGSKLVGRSDAYWLALHSTSDKVEYLQNKYKKIRLRSFNLAEYLDYKKVENVSIKDLQKELYPENPTNPDNSPVIAPEVPATNFPTVY